MSGSITVQRTKCSIGKYYSTGDEVQYREVLRTEDEVQYQGKMSYINEGKIEFMNVLRYFRMPGGAAV